MDDRPAPSGPAPTDGPQSPRDERLRLALDAGDMAVWEIDLSTGAVPHSPELNRMLGFPPDAVPDLEDIRARYAPGERERLRGLLSEAAAAGDAFVTSEIHYLHPTAGPRWLALRARLHYGDGVPRRIVGVVFDVTARKQAEEELRRSEALKEAMLSAALDCIITIGEDSRVIEWNRACERTFGYARDEALGRDLAELIIPPEQREAHYRGMARYRSEGIGPLLGSRVEVEAIRRSGERFPVELAINPTEFGDGRVFTAYLRDLSDRVAAEAALRQATQRLEATYENAFAGIGEVDLSGRFLRVNQEFTLITGYSREELQRRTIWDITHPQDAAAERRLFERHMAGELPVYSIEKRYIREDGGEVWIELSASLVADADGRPLHGVRVVRDISERRRWAEHQRLLINELNHRVKNTLATVQSMAAQAVRSADDPRLAYDTFLERLMALSRAQDLLTRESWEGVDLERIVEGAIQPFQDAAGQRFRVGGPSVWLQPKAALAIAMALHELATNATKYGALSAPGGCVRLDWTLAPDAAAGAAARLCMVWEEEGGPPVVPPTRKGFGSRLLERSLSAELHGKVDLDFRPEGLVCRIDASLPTDPDEGRG